MPEGAADPVPRDGDGLVPREIRHVLLILVKRHRKVPDVLVVFEKQRHTRPARVGEAISIGRRANGTAAHDLAMMLPPELVEPWLDDREIHAHPSGQFSAGELPSE